MGRILFEQRTKRDSSGKFISSSKQFNSIEDLREDFYSRVKVSDENSCWIWEAGKTSLGYGIYCYGNKRVYAHIFSWMLENGKVPEGKEILHECDRSSCVNPTHLEAGTHQKNMLDKFIRGENRNPRGEKVGSAKLTEEQVGEIRKLYSTGDYSHRALADMFSISNRNVCSIVRKETWRHIE